MAGLISSQQGSPQLPQPLPYRSDPIPPPIFQNTGTQNTVQANSGTSTLPVIAPPKSQPNTTQVSSPVAGQPINVAQSTPGIIGSAATYKPERAKVNTYSVNPETDTVAGRVAGLISQNSPLMQQAALRGSNAANDRGLLNSNLAIQSAQESVMGAALPIAQQDASTYWQTGMTNTGALNRGEEFNATAGNTALSQGTQAQNQLASQNLSNVQATNLANTQAQNAITSQLLAATTNLESQKALAQLDQGHRMELQRLANSNSQLLQTGSSLNSLYNRTMSEIAAVQANTNMDQNAKGVAINNLLQVLGQASSATTTLAGVSPEQLASLNLSQFFRPISNMPSTTQTQTQATGQPVPVDKRIDNMPNETSFTPATGGQPPTQTQAPSGGLTPLQIEINRRLATRGLPPQY